MIMTEAAAETWTGSAGGVYREYLCPRREQLMLMPVCMRDWLPREHLVWFVLARVEEMDTRALHQRPAGAPGRRPYLPEMMLALVLYAYCCGIRSSRQIEASSLTDAAFRVICGWLEPDHTTIARFVAAHEQALAELFCEGVRLCAQAGLVDLSVVALDGTKIAADASLQRNRDREWIGREITKLMAVTAGEQGAAGGEEGLAGIAVSDPPARSPRQRRLEQARCVIETEEAAAAQDAERRAQAAAAEAQHGRQLVGRKPKEPHAALARAQIDDRIATERLEQMHAAVAAKLAAAERGEKLNAPPRCRIERAEDARARAHAALQAAQRAVEAVPRQVPRVNVTDPDSRIMSTKDGWVQGYNCQAIVDPHQIVLACDVSQHAGDVQLFEPMTQRLTETLTAAGITDQVELELADAGYCSEHNLTLPGPDRLIATTKDHKQRRAARELGTTDGPPPPNLTPIEEMEHLLRTPQGAAAYAQRSHLIEGVFGDRKHNRQIRRFRRRGLPAVRSEWAFIHLAGNILKLYQHHPAPATT